MQLFYINNKLIVRRCAKRPDLEGSENEERGRKNNFGGAGYRSRYLSHAKRALYHLSYAPSDIESRGQDQHYPGCVPRSLAQLTGCQKECCCWTGSTVSSQAYYLQHARPTYQHSHPPSGIIQLFPERPATYSTC